MSNFQVNVILFVKMFRLLLIKRCDLMVLSLLKMHTVSPQLTNIMGTERLFVTPFVRMSRELPPQLVNQIAAGEVVERPASVLKELLENSLDAAAGRIEIDVEAGGLRLCRVRDDGCGIPGDEVERALARHATSKIESLEDLDAIATLGFRGEALPSMASVSRMTLTSRVPDADSGWRVEVDGGAAGEAVPAAHPPGTTVEVRDLFYNMPARRRFMRTEKTEFGHLDKVARRLALSRFDVAFRLMHNQRPVFDLRAATRARAAGAAC